jgi:hypothetical protein
MESVLDKLEILVKEKKKLANELYETDLIKKISNADYDIFLSMIKTMKDEENNQRILDWKSGYTYACLDFAEVLGYERSETMPNHDEMEEIDDMSFKFINGKLD